MSVRCLILKYATHKGLFVLSAQFGAVQDGLGSFFAKKVEKVLKKGLTKRKKCAVDFISTLIKSTLVNRGKSAIDKEREDELHTKKD